MRIIIKQVVLILIFTPIGVAYSEDYFNPMFLGKDAASLVNLSYLADGNTVTPGSFYLDLYVGEDFIKNLKIDFFQDEVSKKVVPCFTKNIIELIPFSKSTITKLGTADLTPDQCVNILDDIPDFSYRVDMSKTALYLSIPQIYLNSVHSTLANREDWDDGISAYLLNYNFSGSNSDNDTDSYSNYFLSLNNRINIGSWRFNADMYRNVNKVSGSSSQTETKTTNVYLSTDVKDLNSRLTVGQSSLGSNLFDSFSYIGVSLMTANEMLPESQQGYSPPIRGIVNSRSKLTVRQNGAIIYQIYIDPGPYDINDLNPVGSSGDYEVELTSADGVVTKYTVPYSSLPNLLKLGNYNYAATLGQLDLTSAKHMKFFQGSLSVGLPFQTTLYSGVQVAADYKAIGLGLAKDFGSFGALSVDMITADADINEKTNKKGQTYRILYAKNFTDIGTNIQLTGYRYSTEGYYTLSEAAYNRHRQVIDPLTGQYVDYATIERRKNTFQINLSQSLGDYGQFYIWGNTSSYWNNSSSKTIQMGWNRSFKELNNLMVSLNYSQNTYSNSPKNNRLYLSFTMPLSNGSRDYTMYASNSTDYNSSDHSYSNISTLYGSAIDNRLNYNIYQSINKQSSQNTTNINARYSADAAEFRLGTSSSSHVTQVDYGVLGSILVHQDGVLFAREVNDTAILVEAKGAEGARISRTDNITVNQGGYALIPYATAYHYNDVELDPLTYGNGFDVNDKILKVAPTRGAISKVLFDVRQGYNFLVRVNYQGQPIRFGSIVHSLEDNATFIANDDGTVYLTGVPNNSQYKVEWGTGQTCTFTINYSDNFVPNLVNKVRANCL